jgi:hypothetical protein
MYLQWRSQEDLEEIWAPLLDIHLTKTLFKLFTDRIELQSVSSTNSAMLDRTVWRGKEYVVAAEQPKEKDVQGFVAVINGSALRDLLNKHKPASIEMLPGAQIGISEEVDVAIAIATQTEEKECIPTFKTTSTKKGVIWRISFQNNIPEIHHFQENEAWYLLPTKPYVKHQHIFYDLKHTNNSTGMKVHIKQMPCFQTEILELAVFGPQCKITGSSSSSSSTSSSSSSSSSTSSITLEAGDLSIHYDCKRDLHKMTGSLQVSEFLNSHVWDRHGYSLSDIRQTLDVLPDRLIWQLLVAYNLVITNASTLVAKADEGSDCSETLVCGMKSTALTKIMNEIKRQRPDLAARPSILWNMARSDDPLGDGKTYELTKRHVPSLPLHRIAAADYDKVKQYGKNKQVQAWRSIWVAVVEENAEQNLLLMGRVIPWQHYETQFGTPPSMCQQPNKIELGGCTYAFLEESFYFFKGQQSAVSSPP